MLEALIAILSGLLLISELLNRPASKWVEKLRPWQTVIGVVALVVGLLELVSLMGVALILGGLILAASALTSIPSIGDELKRWGRYLAQFGVLIGIALLVLGVIELLD